MNLLLKGDRETAEIVKLFAESYRQQISVENRFVSLYSEIEFLKKYVCILNYRLRNTITLCCEVDVSLYHIQIPKLLIQPLVENAVSHGIEESGHPGLVTVSAEQDGLDVCLCVQDNGAGMDEEQLDALKKRIFSGDTGRSVGLLNVYQRMKLAYGTEATMQIQSRLGQGTKFTLRLPVFREGESHVSDIDR